MTLLAGWVTVACWLLFTPPPAPAGVPSTPSGIQPVARPAAPTPTITDHGYHPSPYEGPLNTPTFTPRMEPDTAPGSPHATPHPGPTPTVPKPSNGPTRRPPAQPSGGLTLPTVLPFPGQWMRG